MINIDISLFNTETSQIVKTVHQDGTATTMDSKFQLVSVNKGTTALGAPKQKHKTNALKDISVLLVVKHHHHVLQAPIKMNVLNTHVSLVRRAITVMIQTVQWSITTYILVHKVIIVLVIPGMQHRIHVPPEHSIISLREKNMAIACSVQGGTSVTSGDFPSLINCVVLAISAVKELIQRHQTLVARQTSVPPAFTALKVCCKIFYLYGNM